MKKLLERAKEECQAEDDDYIIERMQEVIRKKVDIANEVVKLERKKMELQNMLDKFEREDWLRESSCIGVAEDTSSWTYTPIKNPVVL